MTARWPSTTTRRPISDDTEAEAAAFADGVEAVGDQDDACERVQLPDGSWVVLWVRADGEGGLEARVDHRTAEPAQLFVCHMQVGCKDAYVVGASEELLTTEIANWIRRRWPGKYSGSDAKVQRQAWNGEETLFLWSGHLPVPLLPRAPVLAAANSSSGPDVSITKTA